MTRHRTGLSALVLTLALSAQVADAQRSKPSSSIFRSISWSAGAGMSVPTGDLSTGAATGFHVQGTSSYRHSGWPIAIRGELAYHRFGEKDYSVTSQRPAQTVNYASKSSSLAGIVDASYSLTAIRRLRPYLLGGPGIYNSRAELTRVGGTATNSSDTKVGMNVGGGMNFSFIGRSAYLEARYHHVDQAAWIPITFGVRF